MMASFCAEDEKENKQASRYIRAVLPTKENLEASK